MMNKKYRPPHRLSNNYKKKQSTNKPEFKLINTAFPTLIPDKDKNLTVDRKVENGTNCEEENTQNYKLVVSLEEPYQKDQNTNNRRKKGWVYFCKTTGKLTTYDNKPYTKENSQCHTQRKELLQPSSKEILECYTKMCKRWNDYRDEINILVGDLSPYYHYKEELQKMINEDNYIFSQLYHKEFYLSDEDDENEFEDHSYQY